MLTPEGRLLSVVGPPLTLMPGGRLGLGGPPLTFIPGGSLGALLKDGLGPPETLTPSPDNLEVSPGSVSSVLLLTWMPSPARRLMLGLLCSLLR